MWSPNTADVKKIVTERKCEQSIKKKIDKLSCWSETNFICEVSVTKYKWKLSGN